MGDVYRETRTYREHDRDRGDSSSDEEDYRSATVHRYKVTPSRPGQYGRTTTERIVTEVDDDRRSRTSTYGRTSGDLFETDRRSNAYAGDRSRFYEPERGRDMPPPPPGPPRDVRSPREFYPPPPPPPPPASDRPRVTTYETKEVERVEQDWDRRSRFDAPPFEDEVKVEKRIERRDNGDYRVEKRVEEHVDDREGCEVERYRKETEYYTPVDPPPAPAPVIIRQRAPEPQQIIVQEAAPPAPVIIPRRDPGVVVIREREQPRELIRREPHEEEHYYRHERREVGRGGRDYAVERYDRRRHDHDHYSDDEDYYVRRTVVRRRERSESPHHKRHLAEGALAGAGITALINSRRDGYGDLPENRGRKVIAGAALGALGTEALRRAHSAYEDRWHDDDESPDRHSRLKQGLGIAAVALAAAGAAKYYQANKVEKEEAHRGRSRGRGYSDDDYSRSRSRSVRSVRSVRSTKSKSSRRRSLSTAAKAALGTAATAGLVKHFRNKSKSRSESRSRSRSRSKSRLRRGAELAGAAAAAGVASKVWKNHKKKKENEQDYSSSSDDEYYRRRGSRSRSRSRLS